MVFLPPTDVMDTVRLYSRVRCCTAQSSTGSFGSCSSIMVSLGVSEVDKPGDSWETSHSVFPPTIFQFGSANHIEECSEISVSGLRLCTLRVKSYHYPQEIHLHIYGQSRYEQTAHLNHLSTLSPRF